MCVYINHHYLLSCTIGRTFHVREIVKINNNNNNNKEKKRSYCCTKMD